MLGARDRHVLHRRQPVERAAAERVPRDHRGRHDVRDPDGGHRSVGRIGGGAVRRAVRRRAGARLGARARGVGVGPAGRASPSASSTACSSPRLRVPPFVVTLAMMLVVRGAAFKYTDARTISGSAAVVRRVQPERADGRASWRACSRSRGCC